MPKGDLGIDLGTASFIVYQRGKGIVIFEPSVVAISEKTGEIVAIGEEAKKMLGKTPESYRAVKPMKDGVIADYKVIEAVIKEFINRTVKKSLFFKPELVIGIPTKATSVERRAVFEAALNAGARQVHVVTEPIAAAIGAGIDVTKSEGSMIIDIGGGTTDIAVISLGGVVVGDSIKLAGNAMDEAIVRYARRKHGLVIGETTAEQVKIKIGKVHPSLETYEMEIRGRDAVTGLPRTDVITSDDVLETLKPLVEMLIGRVKMVLEKTPPELAADIIERGIVLTGGGALLRGLDLVMSEELGVKVIIAEDPITCVARGTGVLLEDTNLLRTVAVSYTR
ncbi:rod shape-determining protein [Thermotoga caldifontis]|uniref:rod shape-determining protein n=1 Tax=Thermotoga caldifontis TaxID=1508419 RepID=UPI000597B17D|nr:rod shape-determining protein [Thermotoga caldifontis]